MSQSGKYSHITTLTGMTHEEVVKFSRCNLKRYFKVVLWSQYQRCRGCDKPIKSINHATLDHIVPRSRGGRTRLSNLQLMHSKCNGMKSNKMPERIPPNAYTPVTSHRGAERMQQIR